MSEMRIVGDEKPGSSFRANRRPPRCRWTPTRVSPDDYRISFLRRSSRLRLRAGRPP